MRPKKFTDAQREEIKRRYEAKEKVKDLAKEYNVVVQTIYNIVNPTPYSTAKYPTCKELGIDKRVKLSESEIETMQYLYKCGMSIPKLAQKFNVSYYCVRYHVIPGFAKHSNDLVAKAHQVNPPTRDPDHVAALRRERITKRRAAYIESLK